MSVQRNGVMLRTTSLGLAITLCAVFHPAFAQTFDPNAGSDAATVSRTMPGLPSTNPLLLDNSYRRAATTMRASPAPATPTTVVYRSGNFAPIQFNPLTPPPLVQDKQIAFPPVDQTTAAAAQRELAASGATSVVIDRAAPLTTTGMAGTGFVAPAPLIPNTVPGSLAPTPPLPTTAAAAAVSPTMIAPPPMPGSTEAVPVNVPTPLATPEAVAEATTPAPIPTHKLTIVAPPLTSPDLKPMPAQASPFDTAPGPTELSTASKKILGTIPSHINATPVPKGEKLAVSRVNPKVDADTKSNVDAYESSGIKIAVSHPKIDTNAELTQAYSAFSSGDTSGAIEGYKRILAADPLNQEALFGLASIYHRLGQLDKARPLYGVLLKNYPTNRDGLNNFLVLISDESPQEALAELQRLEERNPDFSPIPAQEALLLNKLGFATEARNKMLRAIELAPENLTYKYNLGVMYDSQGDYTSAAEIYRNLLGMTNEGAVLPISAEALQKRLNFIAQQRTPVVTD